MSNAKELILGGKTALGIEFGSTRIKGVLIDYDGNLDFQFETWLMAIGKQNEIDKWRESLNE